MTDRLRSTTGVAAGPRLDFMFEGRRLVAEEGQTIAAALLANGVHVFGRSSKYHRPRGYRCGRGYCSCCAMRVDGLPGVLTCVTKVRRGMTVEREHAWPTADYDALRGAELLTPLMHPGFYYKWPTRLFDTLERGLAHVAGQGRFPDTAATRVYAKARCERRSLAGVLVVGGGLAGLHASLAAAGEGANVVLLERDDRLGGQSFSGLEELTARVREHERIEVITDGEAVGWYDEGTIAVDRHPDLLLLDARAVVLATGAYELGIPFPNCDLPGVMLASGAAAMVGRYGVWPGSTAVVLTCEDSAYAFAEQLAAAGIHIACVADYRDGRQVNDLAAACRLRGIDVQTGIAGFRAHGMNRVSSVSIRLSRTTNVERKIDCDLLCVAGGYRSADDLAAQALSEGSVTLAVPAELRFTPAGLPVASASRVWLVGRAGGADSVAAAIEQGEVAGRAAAAISVGRSATDDAR